MHRKCFNPRAHAGRDFIKTSPALAGAVFQSTRPRGARLARLAELEQELVSIHAPTRGATCSRAGIYRRGCFNPRAHAGRDCEWMPSAAVAPCFNPRAHAGRDSSNEAKRNGTASFNPRAHAGRDVSVSSVGYHDIIVSIHAPTRGATWWRFRPLAAPACFNPRAHAGRDVFREHVELAQLLFQSTRPRGARLTSSVVMPPPQVFQSTRPRGARPSRRKSYRSSRRFQSTRPRGARLCCAAHHRRRC